MNVFPRSAWLSTMVVLVLFAMAGCAGDDGAPGRDGSNGTDGTDGQDGQDGGGGISRDPPSLQGHIPMFPEDNFHGNGVTGLDDDRVLPYDVQAAFNGDTFFWRLSYRGNEGKRHEYIRYTNGAWQREGGDRRDAQATLDGDPQQGDQSVNSTIYEQRTTIMVNDPNAETDVTNFGEFGCFLACHNVSRHMPEWTSASGHDGKYIDPVQAPGVAEGTPVLDLWHWRGARSNPIGRADDQNILSLNFVDIDGDDNGGRKGDAGQSVFSSQNIVGGNPEFLLDPDTTSGKFAFPWDTFWETPFYYMTRDDALQVGPNAPNPGTIAYDDAVLLGYAPVEGDTVPRRILRAGAGSRADITSYGTTFTPETPDNSYGVWNVQMQRALDTGNADDIAMVPGQVYEAGFEVHLWEYTTRDHYVSFPMTVSVGTTTQAVDIQAISIAGAGPEQGPNWTEIPKTRLYLFQPGITTWEFLTGDNEARAVEYTNAQGQLVSQTHPGSGAVNNGTSCVSCHTVLNTELDPPLFPSGAMEDHAEERGGIWEPTPVVAPVAP